MPFDSDVEGAIHMGKILIVDDEPNMLKFLASNLEQDKHIVLHATSVEEARRAIAGSQFEAILTDQKMPDGSGLDVLAAALDVDPTLSVIFLITEATVGLAEEGMRRGAFNFLAASFNPDILRALIQRACAHTTLLRENSRLKATVERFEGASGSGNGHSTNMAWTETLPPSFDLRNLLSTVEKTLIERTLQSTHGAQAEAARRLGLSRSDLSYKLLKYELRKISTSS
jgi:DNA-binding NtrC family response regulator